MGSFLISLYKRHCGLLITVTLATFVRIILATSLELGNDEVYYWTYVKYPDISHFDHPPMLGYLAQIFTFNLAWDSELALRLSAIVCGIISTILIYFITLELSKKRAAIYAAILFSASLYSSLISSVFLMPDNPLVVFWLWSLYIMIRIFKSENPADIKKKLVGLGITIGLAILSKYHAVFIGFGFLLTALLYRRNFFTYASLYISILIAAFITSPIIWWNWENEFVSFGFHGDRVGLFERGIRMDYFFSELFGEVFYNNPVNVALIIVALLALRRLKFSIRKPLRSLLIHLSWPLILSVLFLALFRRTLPHWTGPAYLSLMVISAIYLSSIKVPKARLWLQYSVGFVLLIFSLGIVEINFGYLTHNFSEVRKEEQKVGKYDVTLDMFGWKFFQTEFEEWLNDPQNVGFKDEVLVSMDLYQSAHLDYYVARPMSKKLIAFGPLKDVHKYAWINEERGYLSKGDNALFITHSRSYKSETHFIPHFEKVQLVEKIPIYRNNNLAQNFFVFKLSNYKGDYPFPRVGLKQ